MGLCLTGVWLLLNNFGFFEKPMYIIGLLFISSFMNSNVMSFLLLLRISYSPSSVLGTGHSSEQDGHSLCDPGSRGKRQKQQVN